MSDDSLANDNLSSDNLPSKNWLIEYLAFLNFERGLSPLTRENYARDINKLIQLSDTNALETLQNTHIRRFIASLHSKGLGGKSIARMLSSWRGFFDFLVNRKGFTANPVLGLRAPKSPKTLPQALSIEQASKLVNIAGDDILSVRDHAILELFYSSGLRLSELVNLNLDALDFVQCTVEVTGKGNKTRIVPMGSHAINAIKKWLLLRANITLTDTARSRLFIGSQGRPMSARNIQYRLKEWSIKQGINSSVHPHMLRHSFASHVLQSSGDLRAVQEMLGHANISTTQVYTHLDYQHLAKVYDNAHPRARKK
jgi:integrase/recombinase XerC